MDEAEFNRIAQQGYNRIPITIEALADLDTPLSIYLKLANQPYTYLLESVQGGERFGRYSYIGLPATTRIEVRDHVITVVSKQQSETFVSDDPLDFIAAYQAKLKAAPCATVISCCGLVGYLSYDTIRYIERKLEESSPPDNLNTPDILLLLSEELIVVDNLSGKLYLILYADPAVENAYHTGCARLKDLLAKLHQPLKAPTLKPVVSNPAVAEFPETEFKAAVEKAKRYIYEGDIMQVVLSQRTSKTFNATPLALYRALRGLNPSPYMFFYHFNDFHIVGASPEILVSCGFISRPQGNCGTRDANGLRAQ